MMTYKVTNTRDGEEASKRKYITDVRRHRNSPTASVPTAVLGDLGVEPGENLVWHVEEVVGNNGEEKRVILLERLVNKTQ